MTAPAWLAARLAALRRLVRPSDPVPAEVAPPGALVVDVAAAPSAVELQPAPSPAGDVGALVVDVAPAPPKPRRPPVKRRRLVALAKAGGEIATEAAELREDLAFQHAVLCQVGLPRSRQAGREFERRNGSASVLVTAGSLWNGREWVEQPLPYGAMPRLMLAHMATYAVRHQTRVIPVGESPTEFLRMLGEKSDSGGERGKFTTFQRQAKALAACRLQLGYSLPGRAGTFDGTPVARFEAWLTEGEQRSLWPAEIELSLDYFETLKTLAVPLDLRALQALKGSALALDVYTWLAHRLRRVKPGTGRVTWAALREQFGQEYRDPRNFRRKFEQALREALAVYPAAKIISVGSIEPGRSGFELQESPPPIPTTAGRRVLR